jgi:hypothetical protein
MQTKKKKKAKLPQTEVPQNKYSILTFFLSHTMCIFLNFLPKKESSQYSFLPKKFED